MVNVKWIKLSKNVQIYPTKVGKKLIKCQFLTSDGNCRSIGKKLPSYFNFWHFFIYAGNCPTIGGQSTTIGLIMSKIMMTIVHLTGGKVLVKNQLNGYLSSEDDFCLRMCFFFNSRSLSISSKTGCLEHQASKSAINL